MYVRRFYSTTIMYVHKSIISHEPLTRYVKLRVAHAPGMPGTVSRHQLQRELLVSDPGMHHDTCVTHVPWCLSGSLTRGGGENVPGIPSACATCNFAYLVRGPWDYGRTYTKEATQTRHRCCCSGRLVYFVNMAADRSIDQFDKQTNGRLPCNRAL